MRLPLFESIAGGTWAGMFYELGESAAFDQLERIHCRRLACAFRLSRVRSRTRRIHAPTP